MAPRGETTRFYPASAYGRAILNWFENLYVRPSDSGLYMSSNFIHQLVRASLQFFLPNNVQNSEGDTYNGRIEWMLVQICIFYKFLSIIWTSTR